MTKQELREQELQFALGQAAAELADLALLSHRTRELKADCTRLLKKISMQPGSEQMLEECRTALMAIAFNQPPRKNGK